MCRSARASRDGGASHRCDHAGPPGAATSTRAHPECSAWLPPAPPPTGHRRVRRARTVPARRTAAPRCSRRALPAARGPRRLGAPFEPAGPPRPAATPPGQPRVPRRWRPSRRRVWMGAASFESFESESLNRLNFESAFKRTEPGRGFSGGGRDSCPTRPPGAFPFTAAGPVARRTRWPTDETSIGGSRRSRLA